MEENKQLLDKTDIQSKVYTIRGQQVMLDCDLAEIYGYEVKKLNQQVKRNISRFPEDFMFQLTTGELEMISRSQNVTLKERGKNIKYNPHAFTEQGIYMLATVLRGELAERQSIFIMRTFREMRHYIMQNQQFVTKSENEIQRMNHKIDMLCENFITDKDYKEFVIYRGQKFEASVAYIEIYQQAEHSIYVVDDYVNTKTLQLLSQKKEGVEVVLFTENGHGRKGFLTAAVVDDFSSQYPKLRIKSNPDCHDRLIVLDYNQPTEQVFHCGASSKDAGKKLCAINKLENNSIIHPVMDKLLLGADKII